MRTGYGTLRWVILIGGSSLLVAVGCGRPGETVAPVAPPPAARAEPPPSPAPPAAEKAAEVPEAEEAAEAGPFRFPEDRGGRLLADLLAPAERGRPALAAPPRGQLALPRPASVERPGLPLGPTDPPLPSLPSPPPRTPRPGPPAEDLPLAGLDLDPVPPRTPSLPVGERVRLPSPDVDRPPPLPVLARPASDREPTDDPTTAASRARALASPPPERPGPAPFLRLTVPDPFENRLPPPQGGAAEEAGLPPLPPPRVPGR